MLFLFHTAFQKQQNTEKLAPVGFYFFEKQRVMRSYFCTM